MVLGVPFQCRRLCCDCGENPLIPRKETHAFKRMYGFPYEPWVKKLDTVKVGTKDSSLRIK